ncbi:ABC transporter permease [Cohnella fermenti]|uniref:ABC transporter permease n=1 Tax=Cohnella fermenti TaxID=2565925 RepID=A0A4S4BJ54_9BACL|nr:ABC-2 family transporter protein [Cohnella fermenti]THF74084.1 hypothetical protein E6C55_26730 [Cohnella fermenti]
MSTLTGLLRLYVWHMKLSVSRAMIYRFDFVTGLLVSVLVSGIGPFVQYLFFTQTRGYPGWTLSEILLFQGLLLLWFGIRDLLFGDIRGTVMNLVWKGDFDRLLLKPYPPIGVILCSGFNLGGIGSLLAGILVLSLAARRVELHLSPGTLLMLLIVTLCGLLLYMAISVLFSSILIMLVQMGRIGEMFDRIMDFANYPVNIFPLFLRTALIVGLPFAVWTYYPAQLLLNRADHRIWFAAASCLVLFWLSLKLWNRCLRNYTSAGG